MAEENAGAQGTDQAEEPKKKGKGGMLIAILGVVLIGGGVTAGLVMGRSSQPEVNTVKKNETPVIVEFQDLYVNIAETKATRILKVTAVLELSEDKLVTPMEAHRPIIRDIISEAASRMTIEELEGRNGRGILKREIKNRINDLMRNRMSGAVTDVYFSDFLIQ